MSEVHSKRLASLSKVADATKALAVADVGTNDLKLVGAALFDLRDAFVMFAPFKARRKVTIFGSARVKEGSDLYLETSEAARLLAEANWMVVTGGGPGVMKAGMQGAGADMSFGVNISLPFETPASAAIEPFGRNTEMTHFFTRKVMLCKESHAFIALPGGFGTMDELFELLTLSQTGKCDLAPIVLLDKPGGTYWVGWLRFVTEQLLADGYIQGHDLAFLHLTDNAKDAVAHIERFYTVFDSCRYFGSNMVLRLKRKPSCEELTGLNTRFADLCLSGEIVEVEATSDEVSNGDKLDLYRIALVPDRHKNGLLRLMIDEINLWS